MIVRKRTLFIVGGLAGLLLVLLASLSMLASLYFNSQAMKEKIRSALSREINGTVNFERLDASLLPLPHLTVRNLEISVVDTAAARSRSVAVYPQLLPLMQGRVLLSSLELAEPDITVFLHDRPESEVAIPLLPEVKAEISRIRAALEMIGPGFVVRVAKGKLVFSRHERAVLTFRDIDAQLAAPRSVVEVKVRAVTDAWGPLSLQGKLTYEEDRAELSGVSGTLGRSSFSGLSARLTLVRPLDLQVNAGKVVLSLDELYPWLLASGEGGLARKYIESIKGTVSLSSLGFGGPLARVSGWHLNATGIADDVMVKTSLLPAPLGVKGGFTASRDAIEVQGLALSLGRSSLSRLSARIDGNKNDHLAVQHGEAAIALDELYAWRSLAAPLASLLKDVTRLSGTARLSAMKITGNLGRPQDWQVMLEGNIVDLSLASPLLPGPVSITRGAFRLVPGQLSLFDARGTILDASLTLSGMFKGFPKAIASANLTLDGAVGPAGIQWAFDTFPLPKELKVTPFSVSKARIAWQRPQALSLTGTATFQTGPAVFLDLVGTAEGVLVRRAAIKDQDSSAQVTYEQRDTATTLSFDGVLAQNTLNRIFVEQTVGQGTITGNLMATLLADRHQDSQFHGTLVGDGIVLPGLQPGPMKIDQLSLHADHDIVTVDSATVTLGSSHGLVTGTVRPSESGFVLALTAAADHLDMNEIQSVILSLHKKDGHPVKKTTVTGAINVQAASLLYGRYTFSPVRGTVSIGPSRVDATIVEAGLCGLSTPGILAFTEGEVLLSFRPTARAQQLGDTLVCLSRVNTSMSGIFDLTALLDARGKGSELLTELNGKVELSAKDGVIHKYPLLAKIFSILSVTEIFRGKLPDFGASGFTYHTLTVQGKLKQGKFLIDQAFIDGTSITLIAEGEVDIAAGTADLVVLVAPFSSVNWVIRHIPLLGKVMGGNLISVPVKVSGKLEDPSVVILAPSAVGSRIVELFKNILELPIEIVSPLLPESYKRGK